MDLKQLSNLIHVVELQSFSKAAAFLRIAQPALSRQVKALEDELGVLLLERHGWGVTPTAEGLILVEHARKLLRGLQEAREAVLALQAEPQGEVTLGVPTSVGAALVPELIQKFRRAYPKVALRLVEAFSASVHEWLLAGRLDLAILYETRETAAIGAKPLLTEAMVVIGDAARFGPGQTLGLADVAQLPLILPGRPHRLRLLVDQAMAEARLDSRPEIEVDALTVIKELCRRGEGVTILPFSAVQAEVAAGLLSTARLQPGISRTLVVGERPDRRGTPAMAALEAELRGMVAEQAERMHWAALPEKDREVEPA